jgi:hypothetical protein
MTPRERPALCGVCSKNATMGAWGHRLCGNCFAVWHAESPRLSAVCAMAQPGDVEVRKKRTYGDGELVLLKDGVWEEHLTRWTAGWVADRRKEMARAAAKRAREGVEEGAA